MAEDEPFDWTDNPDVVLSTQMAVAVFENARGEVCLRQQAEPWQDEDQWVTFTKDRAVAVARAILAISESSQANFPPEQRQASSTTGAERQKRYRDRKRVTDDTVTRDAGRDVTSDASVTVERDGHGLKVVANG